MLLYFDNMRGSCYTTMYCTDCFSALPKQHRTVSCIENLFAKLGEEKERQQSVDEERAQGDGKTSLGED